MKPIRELLRLGIAFSPLVLHFSAYAEDRVTILYDAFSDSKEMTKDWDFSVLIELCVSARVQRRGTHYQLHWGHDRLRNAKAAGQRRM